MANRTALRGQTLVLFALTMFLLAVMVIFTLAIGQRVNDRMELQTSADSAAYSEAVATARTLNSLSILNRVEIAHTVSVMGTMALLSYVSLYWRHTDNLWKLFLLESAIYAIGIAICCWPFSFCLPTCPNCNSGFQWHLAGFGITLLHEVLLRGSISNDINLYNSDTLPRWNAAKALGAGGLQTALFTKLQTELNGISLGNTIATNGQIANTAFGQVASRNGPTAPLNSAKIWGATGALYLPNVNIPEPYHASVIADGSRGHPFISYRGHPGGWWLPLTVPWAINYGVGFTWAGGNGESYIDTGWHGKATGAPAPYGSDGRPMEYAAEDWGDHTSLLSLDFGDLSCGNWAIGIAAFAAGIAGRGADYIGISDQPSQHNPFDGNPHAFQPTTFPGFYDYNPAKLADSQDIFGQPTQYALMSRTYDPLHPYPWEMNLQNFPFLQAGENLQTLTPSAIAGVGTVPTEQIALGKGVVYYNREAHSAEPPNLFAPYWRAGLTRLTVDLPPGVVDPAVSGMFNAVSPEYSAEYNGLVAAGYRGFQ